MDEREDEERKGSWLDEVSVVTRLVFFVTLAAMVVAAVIYVSDLFFP